MLDSLHNQQGVDAGLPSALTLVFRGTRAQCVAYIRAHDPHLKHLYLKRAPRFPQRRFYPGKA